MSKLETKVTYAVILAAFIGLVLVAVHALREEPQPPTAFPAKTITECLICRPQ